MQKDLPKEFYARDGACFQISLGGGRSIAVCIDTPTQRALWVRFCVLRSPAQSCSVRLLICVLTQRVTPSPSYGHSVLKCYVSVLAAYSLDRWRVIKGYFYELRD